MSFDAISAWNEAKSQGSFDVYFFDGINVFSHPQCAALQKSQA